MKLLCFGAGAIGTYVGGSLALAGLDIVFLERAATVRVLRQNGLRLELGARGSSGAEPTVRLAPPATVFCESLREALERGPFDAAVYALKAYHTAEAMEAMRPVADRIPPVFCFSNGVENEEALGRTLGHERVIPATVTTAIGRRGPGDIVVERRRGIGIYAGHGLSAGLLDYCNQAGLNAKGYRHATAMKWSKMLTNLLANPTSAILDMTASEVLQHHDIYALEIGMLRECLAVMRAKGVPLVDLPGTPVRALGLVAQLPVWASRALLTRAGGAGRGAKMPSLHVDLHGGRGRTEVEYLHGAVAREGRRCGIPTPINEFLTETVVRLTRREIPLSRFRHRPDQLFRAFGEHVLRQ